MNLSCLQVLFVQPQSDAPYAFMLLSFVDLKRRIKKKMPYCVTKILYGHFKGLAIFWDKCPTIALHSIKTR